RHGTRADLGPRDGTRRRRARGAPCRRAQLRVLAQPLRWRLQHRRQDDLAVQEASYRDRRPAARPVLSGSGAGVPEPGEQLAPLECDNVAVPHPSHDRSGRPARARRLARASAGPGWCYLYPLSARVPGCIRRQLALSRRDDSVQGSTGRARTAHAVVAHGRGCVRLAHRRRQRHEPDAHARRAPGARAGGPCGVGRRRGAVAAGQVRGSPRKQRLQRGLVVAQIAASCVLLGGAGLLTRTMIRLSQVDTGLRTEEVLAMQVTIPLTRAEVQSGSAAAVAATQQYVQMRNEVAALPGVRAVGIGSPLPLRRSDVVFDVRAAGRALAVGEATPRAEWRSASPEFFDAAGIPLLLGRPFATTDGDESSRVMIINQTLADRLFPKEDPIGKRVAWLEWQG